ncbi:hypothetical protein LAZ67_3005780 [Cordylochernes scorpioides]|uniref:Uncharacterized protein n=1 Tax=Cordylochernes scorpioides TaxID=51811 RepID=A0ABY6KAZ5_9ARAC|nr:hypothetical protein LAZ67_3005780 [Cordylochernes scorpioides]
MEDAAVEEDGTLENLRRQTYLLPLRTPGHVVRYCRERRQVFAEARSRNGGEGRNVGFSSRPPRNDADDDYVTPQTSTYFYRSSSPHPSRARSPARRQSQSPARRFSRSPMPQNVKS